VSIDTEGDDVWSRPRAPTTENARFLPRFQALCEAYGLRPTWLVNWEMAHSDAFAELARDVLARDAGEVGMHLHAWSTPPLVPLTNDDARWQPYLVEYPQGVLREKVHAMTGALEERFGRKMVSHRAGRWAMDVRYARALAAEGYQVDSSVTPHVSWATKRGAPWGAGGTDYVRYPDEPYYPDLATDFERGFRGAPAGLAARAPGATSLLEVPMTVAPRAARLAWLPAPVARRLPELWLRPRGRNRADMLFLVERAVREGRSNVQLMLHSSELMPGASPTFGDAAAIDRMYDDLVAVFEAARGRFRGSTFAEYRAAFDAR